MNAPTLHRGRLAHEPKVALVQPLTREDLLRLKQPRPAQGRPRLMRDAHHRLARLVAAGARSDEILRQTGYSTSRFSNLTRDPAFQELVARYREKVDEAWLRGVDEFYETSTSNMLRAERMIEEHLDEADESGDRIALKTLMGLTADRADRFGYGKKSTQRNENLDFAAMMEQIARASGKSNVIDAKKNYDVTAPLKIESPALARLVPGADDGGADG